MHQLPVGFLEWLDRVDRQSQLYLSVVTLHEIEKGIVLLEEKGAVSKAAALRSWLSGLISMFQARILGFEAIDAPISGRLEGQAIAAGFSPGMADAMIAGIAKRRDLLVVTRNNRHFSCLGVNTQDPDALCRV